VTALGVRLRSLAEGLSPSERRLVSLAGACLFAALFWLAVVQPIAGAERRARERAAAAEQALSATLALRAEYDEVRHRLAGVEERIQRGPRGNIFTVLESLATQSGVKVEAMEPQTALSNDLYRETKVQVVLKGVLLGQAVAYLRGIQGAEQILSVKSLRLRTRRETPGLMDVTFTVSSFEPTS
jgi:type II secretory pathway component PulM